ncbi:MAG: thioredoxin [Muribaculaceae bacterium]|nr:thioredoxin [Muribaculaceae bacterium]
MAHTFTDENVHDIIASGKPVAVDFWATWCGPCVAMAPTIDKIAEEYEGRVVVGKYNMDEQNDLAVECRVMALPTILFFKDGKKTSLRLAGSQSYEAIKEKIEELLKL